MASRTTIPIATTGECVRGSTYDSRAGRIRSNDQANMLRLMSSIVCGSQISSPTVKPMIMIAPNTQDPEAMAISSGYAGAPDAKP